MGTAAAAAAGHGEIQEDGKGRWRWVIRERLLTLARDPEAISWDATAHVKGDDVSHHNIKRL